jgi:dihydroorotate dehydrogenase
VRVVRKVTNVELCETLCNNNNGVQHKLQCLKKLVKDETARYIINECLDILRCMKVQGQHMENRMKEYVQGIEKLGFERKREK